MERVKYPRTPHLFWSPGRHDDDIEGNDRHLFSKEVVITEKMDGENTTLYRDHIHSRSIDSGYHPSRTWVKNLWAQIGHEIPENMRVCGENLYGEHSIHYKGLPSYFMVHSVWEDLICLSWDDTVEWAKLLGLETVPVWFRGTYDWREVMEGIEVNTENTEGYVVRYTGSFHHDDFQKYVMKWVRPNHITSVQPWWQKAVVPNELRG